MPATTCLPISPNSGPRWSMVGKAIACNTRSGTLVGPGICRKWRPVWPEGWFLIRALPWRRPQFGEETALRQAEAAHRDDAAPATQFRRAGGAERRAFALAPRGPRS